MGVLKDILETPEHILDYSWVIVSAEEILKKDHFKEMRNFLNLGKIFKVPPGRLI